LPRDRLNGKRRAYCLVEGRGTHAEMLQKMGDPSREGGAKGLRKPHTALVKDCPAGASLGTAAYFLPRLWITEVPGHRMTEAVARCGNGPGRVQSDRESAVAERVGESLMDPAVAIDSGGAGGLGSGGQRQNKSEIGSVFDLTAPGETRHRVAG